MRPAKKPAREIWMDGVDDTDDSPAEAATIVSKARLGVVTGLSASVLDRAFADGAPVVVKGSKKREWQIDLPAFVAWHVRRRVEELTAGDDPDALTFDQAKTRKVAAEAERVEMENARREGKTVLIEEVRLVAREESATIRSQLLAIPGRVAIAAAAESDPAEVEALIAAEVNLALQTTNDK